jgi:hypothetical protein
MIRKLYILLISLMMIFGCSTLQKIDDLERRAVALEETSLMDVAAGVGAATRMYGRGCVDGSCAAGRDLDDLTGMSNGDTIIIPMDPTYGFLVYEYDDPSSTGDDPPWVIDPDTGTGEWFLQSTTFGSIFNKVKISDQTAGAVTVNDYDTGTYFVNDDADAIIFNLPADPTDLVYCFGNGHVTGTPVAKEILITPNSSDYIIFDGLVSDQGGSLQAIDKFRPIESASICIIGIDSSYWKVIGYEGGWTSHLCDEDNREIRDGDMESFEGAADGDFCTNGTLGWTINDGANVFDTSSSFSATQWPWFGSNSMKVALDVDTPTEEYVMSSTGSGYLKPWDTLYCWYYMHMTGVDGLDAGDDAYRTAGVEGNGTDVLFVHLEMNGDDTVDARLRNDATSDTEYFLLSDDTTYRILLKIIDHAGTSEMKIWDCSSGTCTPIETNNGGGDVTTDWASGNDQLANFSFYDDSNDTDEFQLYFDGLQCGDTNPF